MGEKFPMKFSHTIATFTVILGFFYMPEDCDMRSTAEECLPEKSEGFARVWTCEVGYQRPVC
jgi:hypothetical protein